MISRRALCSGIALSPILLSAGTSVRAATAEVQLMQAGLERIVRDTTPGLYLTADWEFDLPDGLVDSLRRGIALYFLYEFRLEKPRWYWMDKTVTSSQLVQRIGYSPLSRQYRFSRGGLTQSFGTLEEVLPLLKHIGDWRVADANAVDDTDKFIAETKIKSVTAAKMLQTRRMGNHWSKRTELAPPAATRKSRIAAMQISEPTQ